MLVLLNPFRSVGHTILEEAVEGEAPAEPTSAPDVPAAQFTKKANRFFVKYAAEEAQPRTRR